MIARELRRAARADKPTKRVEARGVERVKEHERGVKPEGTGEVIQKNQKSLKLSLRGSVEIQAQYWPDQMCKPRTGSVRPDRVEYEFKMVVFTLSFWTVLA